MSVTTKSTTKDERRAARMAERRAIQAQIGQGEDTSGGPQDRGVHRPRDHDPGRGAGEGAAGVHHPGVGEGQGDGVPRRSVGRSFSDLRIGRARLAGPFASPVSPLKRQANKLITARQQFDRPSSKLRSVRIAINGLRRKQHPPRC